METLHPNWVTETPIDLEYKRYLLLAYLQHCKTHFDETKLYPPLGDLLRHYSNLQELKSGVDQLQSSFSKDLSAIDMRKLQLQYESHFIENEHIHTITDLIEFALPNLKNAINDGKVIYDFVERNIEFAPVGIVPVYNHEGYFMINEDASPDIHIYQYHYSIIQASNENLRSLSLNYLYKETRSIVNTVENIKLGLIRRFKELPQPATYLCVSRLNFPLMETLVPVAKRLMMKTLSV